MVGDTKASIFNRINWARLRPDSSEGLTDSNASPVLSWQPGTASGTLFSTSSIGSHADAKAPACGGEERHEVRPDFDINLNFVNSVYALPEALIVLQNGAVGRG